MLDRTSPKPLHAQMEELIKEKLENGEWVPGALIASENELSREYGISRMTVRNVITKLVQEGLLFRIPGKGTYAAENKIAAKSLSYAGIREQLEQMGYEVTTSLLGITSEQQSPSMCKRFGVDEKAYFYVIKRIRFIKGVPLSLHTSYVPMDLCPELDKLDLVGEQLCKVLNREYGLVCTRTQETLESVAARKDEAELLQIDEGHPLLMLHDTILGENGKPYEYACVVFRGDKIRISLEI